MYPYIPITEKDREEMLAQIGVSSVEDLLSDIPSEVRLKRELDLPERRSEIDMKEYFSTLSKKNGADYTCFRGAGAYNHYIPSVVNHVLSRSEFYTAYTPYQPEISQGMLQAIFEYQTMICELTGMDASNASVYDGATAAAEAVFMAAEMTGKRKVVVSATVNPQIRRVVETYAKASGIEIINIGYKDGLTDICELKTKIDGETAGLVVQSPNFFGNIEPCAELFEIAHQGGLVTIMSADPISLALLKTPGELGADIAVGDGQPLGNPINFGGPYVGFMAVREKNVRRLPGRIVGETIDLEGKRGFVLTLQAREQHIRRERATSNICSNQALNALAVAAYLSVVGKKGLKEIANLCMQKSEYAVRKLDGLGYKIAFNKPFFREFVIESPISAEDLNKLLLEHKILGGYELEKDYPELKNHILFCVTEMISKKDIDRLVDFLVEARPQSPLVTAPSENYF